MSPNTEEALKQLVIGVLHLFITGYIAMLGLGVAHAWIWGRVPTLGYFETFAVLGLIRAIAPISFKSSEEK